MRHRRRRGSTGVRHRPSSWPARASLWNTPLSPSGFPRARLNPFAIASMSSIARFATPTANRRHLVADEGDPVLAEEGPSPLDRRGGPLVGEVEGHEDLLERVVRASGPLEPGYVPVVVDRDVGLRQHETELAPGSPGLGALDPGPREHPIGVVNPAREAPATAHDIPFFGPSGDAPRMRLASEDRHLGPGREDPRHAGLGEPASGASRRTAADHGRPRRGHVEVRRCARSDSRTPTGGGGGRQALRGSSARTGRALGTSPRCRREGFARVRPRSVPASSSDRIESIASKRSLPRRVELLVAGGRIGRTGDRRHLTHPSNGPRTIGLALEEGAHPSGDLVRPQ